MVRCSRNNGFVRANNIEGIAKTKRKSAGREPAFLLEIQQVK